MKNILNHLKLGLCAFGAGALSLSAQPFAGVSAEADGSFDTWFGVFSQEGNPSTPTIPGWIQHEEHGNLWAYGDGGDGLWVYDPNLAGSLGLPGWIYTNEALFPYFYVYNADSSLWLRYVVGVSATGSTPRIFVDLNGESAPILLPKREAMNIAEVAGNTGVLSTLVTAVGAADASIAAALTGDGSLTVFAPTNDAFAAIQETVNTLLQSENQAMLDKVLLYHVVSGELSAADLTFDVEDVFLGEANTFYVTTLAGSEIRIDVTPMGVMVNGSAMVDIPNVYASNGVVHVIDAVLLPPEDLATVATNAGFSTLVTAVGAADPAVAAALTGDADLTVFAPTNEAFAAIQDTVNTLLEPSNQAQLTNVLLYHTVNGKFYATDVPLDTPIATNAAGGATIEITADASGTLFVNGIEILQTNVTADNGVIHVIDGVLVPSAN
jgi:uncharacterized surface protein with fasciclin (FAS1) repeats